MRRRRQGQGGVRGCSKARAGAPARRQRQRQAAPASASVCVGPRPPQQLSAQWPTPNGRLAEPGPVRLRLRDEARRIASRPACLGHSLGAARWLVARYSGPPEARPVPVRSNRPGRGHRSPLHRQDGRSPLVNKVLPSRPLGPWLGPASSSWRRAAAAQWGSSGTRHEWAATAAASPTWRSPAEPADLLVHPRDRGRPLLPLLTSSSTHPFGRSG